MTFINNRTSWSVKAILNILKFKLGSEALRNKTKETHYSFLILKAFLSFVPLNLIAISETFYIYIEINLLLQS